MSGERTLNGDPLADEIEHALAVDPSPDFIRCVRSRIAEEPKSFVWRRWPLAGGALAAASVAAFYLTWRAPDIPLPRVPAAAVARPSGVEEKLPATGALPSPAIRPPSRRLARASVTTPPPPAPSPEAAGMRALLANIRDGYVGRETAERAMEAPVVIQPIEIEPLPKLALLPGERQW